MSSGKPPAFSPAPGDWVHIAGMAGVARVLEVDAPRNRARVSMKTVELTVTLNRLGPAAPPEPGELAGKARWFGVGTPGDRIDLHGMRVEEALLWAEALIDGAIVARLPYVKIVTGHGSGAVRGAVREMLTRHPRVLGFRFAHPFEGGMACTVVEIDLDGAKKPNAERRKRKKD